VKLISIIRKSIISPILVILNGRLLANQNTIIKTSGPVETSQKILDTTLLPLKWTTLKINGL
jgi:hypothetical protein